MNTKSPRDLALQAADLALTQMILDSARTHLLNLASDPSDTRPMLGLSLVRRAHLDLLDAIHDTWPLPPPSS